MLETIILGVCVISCIITLLSANKKKEVSNQNYDLKMEIMEKTNQTLIKNYNSISDKYDNLSIDFNKLMDTNNRLIKRCDILTDKVEYLADRSEYLEKRNIKLEQDIEVLKDENKKIIKTLEHYNMMAPHFKLEKPFTMKIVK